jgi:hypothetical protein
VERGNRGLSNRLSLALDVIKEVQNAIFEGRISVTQVVIISQLPKNREAKFLDLIIETQRSFFFSNGFLL